MAAKHLMLADHYERSAAGVGAGAGTAQGIGASEPVLPAFEAGKFEPMPEVEIEPAAEFGAEQNG